MGQSNQSFNKYIQVFKLLFRPPHISVLKENKPNSNQPNWEKILVLKSNSEKSPPISREDWAEVHKIWHQKVDEEYLFR